MYKIVDYFNGREEEQKYETEEQAAKALKRERKAFYDNGINRNCTFCKTIVPAHYSYMWDGFNWVWK